MTRQRVHIVCTANVCRSPLTEALLASALESRVPGAFTVDSSGTRALPGTPIDRLVVSELAGRQLPPPPGSRSLRSQDLGDATLVLTMERSQRGEVLDRWPNLLRRTFTLPEFSRLVQLAPLVEAAVPGPAKWARNIESLASARPRYVASREDDEISDPHGKGSEQFATVLDELLRHVDLVAQFAAVSVLGRYDARDNS